MADFGKDQLKSSSYMFAGLAMMLNIRLVYSASPYALLRFKLPENLFSVFVRIMAGSLELWCLPSMTIANIMDFARKADNKQWKDWYYHWQSIFWSWANFFTFVILWISFIIGGESGNVTAFYWVVAASGFVFGINMVMVYAIEYQYLSWYMVGENSFPMVTSLMHYVGTLFFGNRRKWNSDYIIVTIDIVISLAISLVAAILWTLVYYKKEPQQEYPQPDSNHKGCNDAATNPHLEATNGNCGFKKHADYYLYFIPPSLMVLVGMGLVYAIYPGIAPGMIVPFYLIDKIEMVLLIATAVPPVIIAILKQQDINPYVYMGNWGLYHKPVTGSGSEDHTSHTGNCCFWGKQYEWTNNPMVWYWNLFTILVPLKIILAGIFIYSLHYRDSNISRSIVNQPKMSTFLSILFYMCHEILLAMGFPGISSDDYVLLPIQLVGAFIMVLLAYYSVGYITEYKKHDPSHWPTEGMTKWNAFCYWCKRASKITNHNLRSLFTTDLRRDLLLCIQKNELI